MAERTTLTSRSALDRLLQGATGAGELETLYWFVEMRISPSLAGTRQHVISAAAYPLGWVPVVPVTDDVKTSRHYAELLLACLKSANRGRLIEFGLALTNDEVIAGGFQVYPWGDARWDCVCVDCGAVWQSTGTREEICNECRAGVTVQRRPDASPQARPKGGQRKDIP